MAGRGRQAKQRGETQVQVEDYRYDATRKNNPPIGLVSYEPAVREAPTKQYPYDPHLSPQLVWAGKSGVKEIEVEDAAGAEVETVSLHVHERVSTRAIIDAVRRPEPKQLGLFADPQLPLNQAVRFYEHDVNWANRLILGDSLVVMNSLLERELLGGKVQMIYLDPPYGVKYSSNFQPRIDRRDVKEDDDFLSREPEMIKAYRDTWTLGVHSYLTYLRDRLRVARELLTESGSIFVQIGDENVHLVRCLLDEVFGAENFCALIAFRKTAAVSSPAAHVNVLAQTCDYVIWYGKDTKQVKYRQLYLPKQFGGDGSGEYIFVEDSQGRRKLSRQELSNPAAVPEVARVYRQDNLTSTGWSPELSKPFSFQGTEYRLSGNIHWKTTLSGLARLALADRLERRGISLAYVRYLDDFPVFPLVNVWLDTSWGFGEDKSYVVQTAQKVIQRCLLMTTDPGDLVLDPTCGSGTTAYVAEQWGRRWITIDTSRVALSLARQRILTATYPYYTLANPERGIAGGFDYKTVPHITLKSIAQNTRIDPVAERYQPQIAAAEAAGDAEQVRALRLAMKREIDTIIAEDAEQETLYDQPREERSITRVAGPFTVEAIPPAVLSLHAESDTPIGGAPEPDSAAGGEVVASVTSGGPPEGANMVPLLVALLRQDGIIFPGNKRMSFSNLREVDAGVLHAEGEPEDDASLSRVAISFGPQFGAVSVRQVEDGIRAANLGGYDAVIYAGFAFQAEAQQAISDNPHPRVRAFMSHIRPDVIMTDVRGESLLKTTANSQLFAVFGEPDVVLLTIPAPPDVGPGLAPVYGGADDDQAFAVELRGVDIYDPLTGDVHSANVAQIAAWYLDTDYDGRCFAICQAFFPDKAAWKKLERALKGTLDPEHFDQLTGKISLPFKPGQQRRVAVKVIDQRGNEVMRVLPLDDAGTIF